MRRAWRWWVVAVLVPLLPLGTGQAQALYRCAVDGVARSHCCCPARAQLQSHASLKRDCCDIERSALQRDVRAQAGRVELARVHAPLAVTVWEPRRLAAMVVDEPPHPRVATAIGPPIILAKRSLLL